MGQNPTSTVGLPSNSGTGPSTIGPSPFERSHSTMPLGLRASLPKLPSFKVKRLPEPPKTEKLDSFTRKRSNTESTDVLEREVKKRILGEGDSEMETDLECSSSWDRRPHTISRLDEGERSQSPQQLDDSMDVAPRATIVRSSEGSNSLATLKIITTHLFPFYYSNIFAVPCSKLKWNLSQLNLFQVTSCLLCLIASVIEIDNSLPVLNAGCFSSAT